MGKTVAQIINARYDTLISRFDGPHPGSFFITEKECQEVLSDLRKLQKITGRKQRGRMDKLKGYMMDYKLRGLFFERTKFNWCMSFIDNVERMQAMVATAFQIPEEYLNDTSK